MSFDISKYREMFLEEAAELFESADNVLLAAENNGSLTDDEMGQLFRDVHTLKGSGASVELAFFAEFTHDVENLMDKLRSHKIEYQPEMAETLIDGLDVMKEILELEVSNQINREKFQELTSSLLEDIRAYSNGSTTNKKEEEQITQSVKVLEKIDTPISDEKEEFGFFSDDLNSQRDRKDMPFGIFEDDDTDENHHKHKIGATSGVEPRHFLDIFHSQVQTLFIGKNTLVFCPMILEYPFDILHLGHG